MDRTRISVLVLGLLILGPGGLHGAQKVTTLPTYSQNPFTGAQTVSGGYYNPTTGRGSSYYQSNNMLTGRTRTSATTYNNFTGNMTHRGAMSNPMTGVTRRTTVRRR